MAHKGLSILLLSLALVISTVYGINGTDPQCNILSNAVNSSSAFNLTVSPETLSDNTNYTVSLQGTGNYTVILQALSTSNSTSTGKWSNGNISCDGSPLFLNAFENGNNLQAQWQSPASLTSVNITAHIHNEHGTFVVSRTLHQAAMNFTTVAPGGSNGSTSMASATTTTRATTIAKTTSGGCAVQAGLLTMALLHILGFLTITGH